EQPFGVVDDAITYGPLHSADPRDVAGFVVQATGAGAVERTQILQRVVRHDRQIGQHADAYGAVLGFLAGGFGQRTRRVVRHRLDRLQRRQPGFVQELQLGDVAEAVQVVDE